MKAFGFATGLILAAVGQAQARDSHFERTLRNLEPSARLEQLCDYTAMQKIRGHGGFRPDRAVGYAVKRATVKNDTIEADGAAFRSRGKWYALSYSCKATPDHMKVLSFSYKVGPEIPEEKWSAYGLWK